MANNEDLKKLLQGAGDIPIIGKQNDDPLTAMSKSLGLNDFVLIGRRFTPDDGGGMRVEYVYLPYHADLVTQLGLMEFGELRAQGDLMSMMTPDDHGEGCQCGKPNTTVH